MQARIPIVTTLALALTGCGGDSASPTPPEDEALQSVAVTVSTTGEDQDDDGYTVSLGSRTSAVSASGSAVFDDVPPGTYDVGLSGVAANCTVVGGATRSVTVTSSQGVQVAFDVSCETDYADGFTTVACPDVSLSVSTAASLDAVPVGRLPQDLEDTPWAHVTWPEGDEASEAFMDVAEDGPATLVVPLHPTGNPDGGPIMIRVTDGTRACPGLTLTVDPLPSAPGEFGRVLDAVEGIVEGQAAAFGFTPQQLLDTDPAELPEYLLPVAISQSILGSADTPNSLRSMSEEELDAAEAELLDRLLARVGLAGVLEDQVATLQDTRAQASPGASSGLAMSGPAGAAHHNAPCSSIGRDDVAELDQCMRAANSAEFKEEGVTGDVLDDLTEAWGYVEKVDPSQKIAKGMGVLIWMRQVSLEGMARILPSRFVSIDYGYTAEFMEDEDEPGEWEQAMVSATSRGWKMDRAVLEAVMTYVGTRGDGFDDFLARFEFAEDPFAKELADMVLGEVFDAAIEHTDGSDFIEVPPKIAGPVDVSSPQWSDRHLTEGTSVELTSHREYEPVEPGQSMLEVRTVDPEAGQFGFQQVPPPGEPVPIEVKQIQIGIEPDDVTVEPDEITFFTVTVTNSAHPEMVEIDNPDALQGDADIEHDGGSTHTISYQAPADPDPEQVDLLTVRHTAETGARRNSTDERLGQATIRFGEPTLRVSPRSACLEPGQTLQFTAEVEGLEDETVRWSTDAGTIGEATGLYTAGPDAEPGSTATITATSASDPDLTDQVTIEIGPCLCRFDVTLSGGMAGISEGPAGFGRNDGGLQLDLGSADEALTTGDPILLGVDLASWNGGTGTYSVTAASATHSDVGTAWYEQGVEGLDCPSCGGTLTIDRAEEESVAGSYEVTMPAFGFEAPPVTAVGTFRAHVKLPDVALDPYRQCLFEYEEGG